MNVIMFAAVACLGVSEAARLAAPSPPPPLPLRVADADVIVVGKVTALGDQLVSATAPFGQNKVDYRVAVVRVNQIVAGVKDVKEIKVGIVASPPPNAAGRPQPPKFTLHQDQEGLLFLMKHPAADFYVGEYPYDIVDKDRTTAFDMVVHEAKRYAKMMDDPGPLLTGADKGERQLVASMLVSRWRTRRPGMLKTEPVRAERSKQVLQVLADADWDPAHAPVYAGFPFTPHAAFMQLGVGPDDGWVRPKEDADFASAAQRWLREHAATYRIQRVVAEDRVAP